MMSAALVSNYRCELSLPVREGDSVVSHASNQDLSFNIIFFVAGACKLVTLFSV